VYTLDVQMTVPGTTLSTEVSLKFRFGDWCIHVQRLAGSVLCQDFTSVPPAPAMSVKLDPDSQVLLMRARPLPARLPLLDLTRDTIRYVPVQYLRHYVDLSGGFAAYVRKFSRRSRSELQRKVRRFSEDSKASPVWREYRCPAEMPEFHRLARQVSERSFQARLGVGLPVTEEFRSQLAARAAQDSVRGFILFHGNRPAAYELCHANGGCLTGEHCGYDPEFARLSPGTVLLYCVLEHLFAQQSFARLDFGAGDAEYKASFATGSVLCGDIYYFRKSRKNFCLVAAHCALRGAWWCAAKTLDFVRLRRRLKKLLRRSDPREE